MKKRNAKFIVIEGVDGCGKSTQALLLEERMRRDGYSAARVRDPGSTQLGEKIRRLLLDPDAPEISATSELLLFLCARCQSVAEQILPDLEKGIAVISERYNLSSLAYQGALEDISSRTIRQTIGALDCFPVPDLTIILDVDPAEAFRRKNGAADRIESRGLDFQKKVRDVFLREAVQNENIVLIDGQEDKDRIADTIYDKVKNVLGQN